MDIAALSTAMATSDVQSSVSISMLSKSLDTLETVGEGLVKIMDASAMERSVSPHLGGNIDLYV